MGIAILPPVIFSALPWSFSQGLSWPVPRPSVCSGFFAPTPQSH